MIRMLWKGKKRKTKLNNAGMSLVEVIISITILALVVVPVLRAMTSAVYYNAKARTRQSVTLSAESLMETFKGYDVESLKNMFERAAAGDVSAIAELGITQADGFEYPSDLNANELNFKVVGLQSDDGKTTCDVEIKATKQGYSEVMELTNILPTRDAIFRGDRDWDTSAGGRAQDDFKLNYQDAFLLELNTLDERDRELTQSDIDMSCLTLHQRELSFTVSNDGTNDIVTASMVYTYYLKQHPYYEKVIIPEDPPEEGEPAEGEEETETESSTEEAFILEERKFNYPENEADFFKVMIPLGVYAPAAAVGEYTIYSNSVTDGQHPLERVYIYYYPIYGVKDIINIKNNAGLTLDCYFIKQKATDMSNTQLQNKETSYKPYVNGMGTGNVNFYHNLNTNLGGSGTTQGASHITSFVTVSDYAGSDFIERKVLVYKLEMKVLTNGTEVATFEGTMNEYMDYTP